VAVADVDVTAVDVLQAREHAERRRLATARGADEDEELAVLDVQVELVHGGTLGPGVEPGCVVVGDRSHDWYIPPPAGTCRTIRCAVTCHVDVAVRDGGRACLRRHRRSRDPPGTSGGPDVIVDLILLRVLSASSQRGSRSGSGSAAPVPARGGRDGRRVSAAARSGRRGG